MAEKLYQLAESMTKVRNTKLYEALLKSTTSSFIIIFMMSGVMFVNSLLPNDFKFTILEEASIRIYALIPLLVAYYFGSKLKYKTMGIISMIVTLLVFQDSFKAENVIVSLLITVIIVLINTAIEYIFDKISFPSAIPSTALEHVVEWVANILTLVTCVILISVVPNISFLQTLAQWILTIGISPVFYFTIILLSGLFWTVGLHGDRLTGPFFEPFLFITMLHNLVGLELSYTLNSSFHVIFGSGSGSGITLSLIIALLLFSKDKVRRAIAKDNIASGMFNINEGVVFGLPIVESKTFIIPFMIAPLVSTVYGYIMISLGVIKPYIYAIPWVTPPFIKSFIASGGQLLPVLVEMGAYALCVLIYIPFVLKSNKETSHE